MTSHARARLFARVLITLLVAWGLALGPASAQRIIFSKGANGINPDGTVDTGTTFSYRIPYNCNAVVGDCEGVRIIDLLPAGVQFVGAIGNSDVATINAPSSGTVGTGMPGGPQIEFVFIDPLPAGNSGDLTINVRFPNGSTPDGFVATNTAEVTGTNLTNDGEVSNPVDVTALADLDARVVKTLQTNPANLNQPVTYRVRVEVVNDPGNLNLGDISVVDTLPPGVTFLSATSGGVYDPVGETVTWAGPFTATVGSPLNLFVTVQYDTPTFTDGQNVTNSATATGTPLGGAPQGLGVGDVTHPVITFTPNASVNLDKRNGSGFNFPPGVGQDFPWDLEIRNNGNVPVDDLTMIDTIPDEVELISVATGAYNNPSATVAVSYTTNLNAVFQPWGSSPGGTSATFTVASLGLGAGEYVDQVRWAFGTAPVGMAPTNGNSRARITVRSIDPDRLGGPVGDGTTIENCASATWTFMAAPGSDMDCSSTTLDGLYTLSQPRKEERTSSPYTPGATVSFRLRVNNRSQATAALPTPIVTDLLPRELTYTPTTFSYDDRGTGVAAPTFEELPNYNGTERTLLRWTFADDLAPGDEVWIEFDTTLAVGARFGTVTNTFGQTHNDPGLSLRCTGSTRAADALDLDGDGDTTDFFCNDGENLSVAPVAQLASEKLVRGQCDTIFTKTPQFGVTFPGGFLDYRFTVRNIGTVAAEDFTIVDLLPRVGDTGVLDTTPRLSGWSPFLAEPITPPPNAVVFYSTADNPCRPEVGGPSTGCDAPNWSTIPPVPISATRAFRITFERTVLEPEDILTFDLRMIAPADAPITADTMNPMPNDIAWNSFAYLGQRSDGAGSLNAEPNKVGIVVKAPVPASLGDFVWLDTNGDGVQNDGPTGVNDVRVELYDLGPDGLPNSGDENLLGTTLTADDAAGDPGWYTFTGLSAGDYTVCFVPPPNFLPTTPDQGGSDAFDSDVDPMTLCTPPIMLPGGAVDPDWDFGLLPPTTASLGNYAWFDDNANGVQDDGPSRGVNGVTVTLYIDRDGDGNPEPGGDDGTAVGVTATADDGLGAPGFYGFDMLTPGVPYFVVFDLPPGATGFTTADQGGDDALDSDANTGTGATPPVVLAAGENNPTLDAGLVPTDGPLALGDLVWCDDNGNGVYEPGMGEEGVDGVRLSLYIDLDADGLPDPNEFVATTSTVTLAGNLGRYRFENLLPGDYLVQVDASNFAPGGPLAGKISSTGNDPAPDPDDDVNQDDNGTNYGVLVLTSPVTLATGTEPTSEDGDDDTNLTVDLGFQPGTPPVYDYGDAPDAGAGGIQGDYPTVALDNGPHHLLTLANAPYLGDCVDGDSGTQQSGGADADDNGFPFGAVTDGTCLMPGADEDGVMLPAGVLLRGSGYSIDVRAATGLVGCTVNGWIDYDRNGIFGDSPGEQIATDLAVAPGTTETVSITVPATAVPGPSYARFRCSTQSGLGPDGPAPDGEVEDYLVELSGKGVVVSKTDAVQIDTNFDGFFGPGDTLRYTATILNAGSEDALDVIYTSNVDPNTALVVGSVTTSQGTITSGNTGGDTSVAISIGTIASSGGTATVTYDVMLGSPILASLTDVSCQALVTGSNFPDVPSDDPDLPGPEEPTDTPVVGTPALTASKTDAVITDSDMDGLAGPGDTVRYTVVVTNTGDQEAAGVTFTTAVDANSALTVGSVTTSQGTVTTGNGGGDTAVAVAIGSLLGAGGTATVTFDVTVDDPLAMGATQLVCQGSASGANAPAVNSDDPSGSGGDDPTLTPLDLPPMLTAVKGDALLVDGNMDGSVDPGDTIRYTVTITNAGGGIANDASYTSAVDPNTTLVVGSVTTSQGAVTTGNTAGDTTVLIAFGDLAVTDSVTVTYDVALNDPIPAGLTDITCQGSATSTDGQPPTPTDDPDSPAGGDGTVTPVGGTPELEATKADALENDVDMDGLIDGGDTVRYTVVVTNVGDQDASNATFTTAVDAASTLVVGSVTTSQGTVTTGNTAGDTTVAVDLGAVAGDGGAVTITFDVTVNDPIAAGVTELTCQGAADADNAPMVDTSDPDTPAGGDPTLTPLDLPPMLTAVKGDVLLIDGDMDGNVEPGDTVRYTVTITNTGGGTADGAAYASGVDPNTTLVVGSVTTTRGTVTTGNTAGDATVAVTLGDLVVTDSVTITYDVTLNDPIPSALTEIICQGSVTNTDGFPPTPTDDPDTPAGDDGTVTPVGGTPELEATKVDAIVDDVDMDGLADAGDTVRYTVVVTNVGDQDASNATFTSAVDPSSPLVVGSVTTSQGTVTTGNAGGDTTVAVDLGAVAGDGGAVTITFDVIVVDPVPPGVSQLTCQGEANADNASMVDTNDPDTPDPNDPTLTPVDSPALLTATKADAVLDDADGDGSADPGDTVRYTVVVTNVGGEDATGAVFTSAVDALTTLVVGSVTTSQGIVITGNGGGDASVAVDLGTVQGSIAGGGTGQSVTITYDVTINFPLPSGATSVACQGAIAADGLPSVDTDDPDTPDPNDPTLTPADQDLDFGDVPDTYGTTLAMGGAFHGIVPGLQLGGDVDEEDDGAPSPGADGDDVGDGSDDEDGVTFATGGQTAGTASVTCQTTTLDVAYATPAGVPAFVDAWIDFDGSGTFDDPAEHLFGGTPMMLPAGGGTETLTYTVPCDAAVGDTYARVRYGTDPAGSGPTGPVPTGEVEDYVYRIVGADFGDNPDSYATTFAAGGPYHGVDPLADFYLGSCVDIEVDGQPNVDADGDDFDGGANAVGTCAGTVDEDGIAFDTAIIACDTAAQLTVTSSGPGIFDGWIDFAGDGDFTAPTDRIFAGQAVAAGGQSLTFEVPCTAVSGSSYARFRLSTGGTATPGGFAPDGEIEDYVVEVRGLDFGDAPDPTYPTSLASDGARHGVLPVGNPTLGGTVDTEPDGQPDAQHLGDDQAGIDDEDGATLPLFFIPSDAAEITLATGAAGGLVNGWIDFNRDGDWDDAGEQVFTDLALGANATSVESVPVPALAVPGVTCLRLRIDSTGGLTPTGRALDGEVEDYEILVIAPSPTIGAAKSLLGIVDEPDDSYVVSLQLRIENLGNVDLADVNATMDFATDFADAESFEVVMVDSFEFTVNQGFDGDADRTLLAAGNTLAIGEIGLVDIIVRVRPGANPGPYVCSTEVSGASPDGTTVTDVSQNGDTTDPDGNGDPTDDDEPTVIEFEIPVIIPTLGDVGLGLMALLLALVALRSRAMRMP